MGRFIGRGGCNIRAVEERFQARSYTFFSSEISVHLIISEISVHPIFPEISLRPIFPEMSGGLKSHPAPPSPSNPRQWNSTWERTEVHFGGSCDLNPKWTSDSSGPREWNSDSTRNLGVTWPSLYLKGAEISQVRQESFSNQNPVVYRAVPAPHPVFSRFYLRTARYKIILLTHVSTRFLVEDSFRSPTGKSTPALSSN